MAHGDYLYLAWAVVPGSRTRFCLGSVEVVGFLRHQGTEQWVSPSSGAAGLGEGVPSKKKKDPPSAAAAGPGILLGLDSRLSFSIDCLWALPDQTFRRYFWNNHCSCPAP